ncbi:MAG: ribosome-associated translation inhibitor RaiA [Litorilinea sp.]
MQLIVLGRNVEVNDRIREYVERKVGKLDRYLPQVTEGRVEITHNATRSADDRYTVQITIWANGQILRAEESTGDVLASIDASADKMYRQMRRFKGRKYHGKRRAAQAQAATAEAALVETMVDEDIDAEEEELGTIVRRKEFPLQPMSEEEALEQMALLGHDFFVYYDLDSRGVNVVYRRRDGQYGLLQPKLD